MNSHGSSVLCSTELKTVKYPIDTGFLLENSNRNSNSDQIFCTLGSLEASKYNSQPLHFKNGIQGS